MQSETVDFAQMPPPGEPDKTYAPSLILTHSVHYVKTWRHPQNRKYITYCIAITEWPSHGHRKTVVRAFVSSRLDNCNSVVRCYRQFDSTSSSCSNCCSTSSQWHLPMRAHHASIETTSLATSTAMHCIEFKMAVLVYKALNGLSPQYLADNCQLITTNGRWRLRSSNVATCEVQRTRTSLSDRSFTAAGPRLWNNLPLYLCDIELPLLEFCRLLKTHLFGWWS